MYDTLWEENPKVQQTRAEAKAQGLAEGELCALKRVFINVIKVRLPALAERAEQEVKQINDPGVLDLLVQQISAAPDENMARWLLSSITA